MAGKEHLFPTHHFDAVDGFCLALLLVAAFMFLRVAPDFLSYLPKGWKQFVEMSRKLRQQANDRYEGTGPAKGAEDDFSANLVKWLVTAAFFLAAIVAFIGCLVRLIGAIWMSAK